MGTIVINAPNTVLGYPRNYYALNSGAVESTDNSVSVTGWNIAKGDGTTTVFTLPVIVSTLTNLYRRDWQGNTLLSTSARVNVAPYSEDVSQSNWSKINVTAAAALAPDGTNTAFTMTTTATANTTLLHTGGAATATTVVFTIFAKTGGTRATVPFIPRNNTTATSFTTGTFNASTGAITGTGWTSTAVPGAPGWYRLSFTQSTGITAGDNCRMYCGGSGGSLAAGLTWTIWGIHIGSAGGYIKTGATAATVTDYSSTGTPIAVTMGETPSASADLNVDAAILPHTYFHYFRSRRGD